MLASEPNGKTINNFQADLGLAPPGSGGKDLASENSKQDRIGFQPFYINKAIKVVKSSM